MKNYNYSLLALALSASFVTLADDKTPAWSVDKPIGKFEDIKIDVQSGTWMNVSVSPDGKTIAFDLLGDIYTMPISGGKAKLLTSDIAWQMQPVFSPDGKHIAFTSDQGGGDNIWVMNTDGSNQTAVTKETFRLLNSPAWSPDSEFIVARKHFTNTRSLGAGEVWQYHKTGGAGMMLTAKANDEKDLGEPAFSPDGKYIYFSQDDTPGKTFHYSKDSEQGIYVIKRFERETGNIEVLLSGAGGAIRPTPSPDGKYLAYIRRVDFQSTLFLYNLETGEQTKLDDKLDRDMQETWAIHGVYPTIGWTPDNQSLVYWAGGKINKFNLKEKSRSEIPFHIERTKKIQTAQRVKQDINPDQLDVKMLGNVQVSPDGNTAVYSALGHLYTKQLPSGTPRRLTSQTDHFEFYPQFSRDGKQLVYVSWHDDKQGAVHLLDLATGQQRVLTPEPGKYVEPTLSPDGRTVVYRKSGAGSLLSKQYSRDTGLYAVPVSGAQPPKLIARNGFAPMFGKDNERVFAQDYGQSPVLLSIDLATEQQRTLYSAKYGTEFKLSPDGKYLAFIDRFKVYVTPFAERGAVLDISGSDTQFPVKQLSVKAGSDISWTADSASLYWHLGPELYHSSIAGLFDVGSKVKIAAKNGAKLGFDVPMATPTGTVAFVGGQVITMEGDEVLQDAVVLVEGNLIKAVGSKADVQIPSDAKVIDISGKTLMPGLFDAHAHGPQGVNQLIPQRNYVNYASLALGVTSIHDPSNDTQEIFTASELQKAGLSIGPRIFSTGTILYGAYGAGYTSHVDSLDDAKFHMERLKKVGAFSVKSYNQPRREQRQQIIEAARELDMMVVPEGGSLMQHNLSMAVDGHTTLEHSLAAAVLYDDVKQLWSQTKTAYTPTLIVAYGGIFGENYWYDKTDVWKHPRLSKFVPADELRARSMRRPKAPDHHYNHVAISKMAKELNDLGVVTNMGAHGQRESLGAHWEIWMFAQGGMSPLQALKTATINPAKTFGMDQQLGSIKAGKLADLIILDADPLKNIRDTDKVKYSMVNGRLFDAETMDELHPQQVHNQPFFFQR
ncbi:amidohydrolase family protein [Rheinheimera marina]|uniref:Amidohydrolase family protein n=1 Tax=Rheinheimera marina TaxID=1774958 RepID=A0ABV9JKB3_9GAMM